MNESKTGPAGEERRVHQMYVTRNTEYHFREARCVAVRDRNAGRWLLAHLALDRPLTGSIRFRGDGEAYPSLELPRIGDALFFGNAGPDVITSEIAAIQRPPKELVENYPF